MEILYSPWRLAYVTGEVGPSGGCVFCAAMGDDHAPLVAYRDGRVAVVMNRFPYNNGHLLVVPRPHVDSLSGLPAEVLSRTAEVLAGCESALRKAYGCHGINMGLNLGEAAGAGIVEHIHWHALPRWRGDTNFMTAVGGTRVVPEEPEAACARLRPHLATLLGPG